MNFVTNWLTTTLEDIPLGCATNTRDKTVNKFKHREILQYKYHMLLYVSNLNVTKFKW